MPPVLALDVEQADLGGLGVEPIDLSDDHIADLGGVDRWPDRLH